MRRAYLKDIVAVKTQMMRDTKAREVSTARAQNAARLAAAAAAACTQGGPSAQQFLDKVS